MTKKTIDENLVFNAALEEFTLHSYDEASLNAIIKNAHISKGSFYYRFENKYALYLFLIKNCIEKKWQYIKSIMSKESEGIGQKDIFDQFLIQADMAIEFAEKFPKYHKLNKMFSKEKGSKLYDDILLELGQSNDAGLDLMIQKAYENGDLDMNFSKDFISRIITYMFASFDDAFMDDDESNLEKTKENLTDYVSFMRNGLGRK